MLWQEYPQTTTWRRPRRWRTSSECAAARPTCSCTRRYSTVSRCFALRRANFLCDAYSLLVSFLLVLERTTAPAFCRSLGWTCSCVVCIFLASSRALLSCVLRAGLCCCPRCGVKTLAGYDMISREEASFHASLVFVFSFCVCLSSPPCQCSVSGRELFSA